MSQKIIVCIEVPSISEQYEIRIPDFIPVRELMPLFRRAVKELSNGSYVSSGQEFLCARRQNCLVDEDAALKDYGIQNGDHLILL